MTSFTRLFAVALAIGLAAPASSADPIDVASLTREPDSFKGVTVADGKATLTSDKWAFLLVKVPHADAELAATFTILEPARHLGYFGQAWSVWPDPTFPDGGFEAGVLLRAGEDKGYRVQLSHRYKEVTLVKYPDGGYLQSVPCEVKLNQPVRLAVSAWGNEIVVEVNGKQKIRYRDDFLPPAWGRWGVGVHSNSKVTVENVALEPLAAAKLKLKLKHAPDFSVRKWLGERRWIFDGHEPILMLPVAGDATINNVKLRPGYRPQLSWNGIWDITNQGVFPDGKNEPTDVSITGGGKTVTAQWTSRQVQGRFVIRTKMTAGYDERRGTYRYDIGSELEVTGKEPFHFRYGYDFEHHTPLDPFRWQYLVFKRQGGALEHRPVYPVDPGGQYGLQGKGGLRMWYGRHGDEMLIAPAVEYHVEDQRKLHFAVCAAFYDTGFGFEQETAAPGTKVKVQYSYTGYPANEAEKLFKASTIYDSLMLDPKHHYVFADEWPRLTFSQFVPMSKTWVYGRTPFMTGHNQRPTYELAKVPGVGSGFAMKLVPGAFGKARLPAPSPLPKGRWVVTAKVKSDNAHGPGGRIELFAEDPKDGKALRHETHYFGNGSFDWKTIGFVTDVPGEAPTLATAFGNAGTGEVFVTDVEFRPLADGAPIPAGVLAKANATPPMTDAAPNGALADFRMQEGKGLHVHDYAGGPFGKLELANLDWVVDGGKPALRFSDNTPGRKEYPRAGVLDRGYMSHPNYTDKQTVPVANAGTRYRGLELKAFTVAAWVKPGDRMPDGRRGDVVGLGARRFILSLYGDRAPYALGAAVNVNEEFASDARLEANQWYHVAMTGEPTKDKKWRIRLFIDGKPAREGVTEKAEAPTSIPDSLVLGTELFYFHSSYYRGLLGRTLVFDRALSAEMLAELVKAGR